MKKSVLGIKKKLLTVGLATSMAMTMVGCSKDVDGPGYCLTTTAFPLDNKNGLYDFIINRNGFGIQTEYKDTVICKVDNITDSSYGTNYYYEKYLKIIIPSVYDIKKSEFYNNKNFNFNYRTYLLTDLYGNEYLACYSYAEALTTFSKRADYLGKDSNVIFKGDVFKSEALYCNGELVAFKQTGAGSDSPNVVNANLGDFDIAINRIDIENRIIINSIEDLYKVEESFNACKKLEK